MKNVLQKLRQVSIWGISALVLVIGVYHYGHNVGASTITYQAPDKEVVEVIKEVTKRATVMNRIAKCESDGMHTKNGKLVVNTNKDGSVDVGLFQINMKFWGLKAMEMELNLTKEDENTEFAYWLYDNYGTEPWVHTKHCWNK